MATQKTIKLQQGTSLAGEKLGDQVLVVGDLVRAKVSPDGVVTIKEALNALKLVDVADVDLLLTFANGDHVIIPNGALDALGPNPPDAVFSDQRISLPELFRLVGVANPAKAGSLRLVTENIDANPPPADNMQRSESLPDTAPPAPMVKVGVGTSTGSGKGSGNGAGDGEGEVPAMVVPMVTAQPAVFRAGKSTQSIQDILIATALGQPNFTQQLYTSSQFKVAPSGRSDLPLGAYDPGATSDQLAVRASPAGQSTREVISGTAGNDAIDFNAAFSTGVTQWSMTLHLTINNFSDLTSIQLVANAAKIALIPGFDLAGLGVTRDGATSNSWHVAPTADMLLNGLDIRVVYNIDDSAAPVDFGADVIINGHAGPLAFEVVNNLNFTWRDAVTTEDYTVTSSTGAPLMVLPRAGVGVEVFAGIGDDVVNAGAGADIVHGGDGIDALSGGTGNDFLDGGLGADSLDGGQGNDTATYENSATGVTATLDAGLGVLNTNEAVGDTYVNIENLKGSLFDDILIGDAQSNVLTGSDGNDMLVGRGNGDTLDGGAGIDTASYEYATSAVTVSLTTNKGTAGEADGDVLVSIENLIGGAGNDTFTGAAGIQSNAFDGRSGTDTVSYAPSTAAVVASLTTGLSGVVQSNDAAGDTFASIENLTGSIYADTLIGDGANNVLTGGIGNDLLEGLGGADSFAGGVDTDTVSYAHSAAGVISSLTTVFAAGPAVLQTNDASGDTYTGIENLIGTDFADTLIADGGSNSINGGLGDDVLEGMGSADMLDGGAGNDTASYAHSTGYVRASLTSGLPGFSAQGDAAGDIYTSIENLTGSGANDTLVGDGGANTLAGGAGDDVLEGLAGADVLDGGSGNNTASYEHAADQGGGIGVTASLVVAASNTGDALGDSYSNIQNLVGSAFDDTLTGDAGANIIDGGIGNDIITSGLGADTLYGGDGNDILSDGLEGAAKLYGGADDDTIIMTSNDNLLDLIDGGSGTDTLVWAYAGSLRVDVNLQLGTVNFYGPTAGTYVNFSGIENFTAAGTNNAYVYANNFDNIITGGSNLSDWVDYRYAIAGIYANLTTGVVTGGSGNDTLTGIEHLYMGSQFNDTLIGNSSNNDINGGYGADYIDGAGGIDTARYDQYNNGSVTVSLMAPSLNTALGIVFTDTAAGDTLVNIEQLVGSGYNDFLYGDGGANYLNGNGGDDVLEGMAGADSLEGAGGTDTASYANAGLAAAGAATTATGVGVTVNLTTVAFVNGPAVTNSGDAAGDTFSNIENLTGSSFNDVLIGNSGANVIDGGFGDDELEGLAGADVYKGGAGIDTVSFAHSNAGVTMDLSNGANGVTIVMTNDAVGDQYSGIENITGSIFNDILYGDGSDNVLTGGLGNDLLDGGSGTDTASYATATGAVTINLAGNTVSGAAGTDSLVSIEKIIGSGFADTITGSAGNDIIDGGAGADIIDGGAGVDTISYVSATGPKSVTLNGANTDGDTLLNFENILGSTYGDVLTGDAGDNSIEGGLGDDTLNGGANGATGDTASYASATAAVFASLASGTASGGAGNDVLSNFESLTGSSYDDTLTGDGSVNKLDGGLGNDFLIGGAGADSLIGGGGTDTASYTTASSAVVVTINGAGTLGDASGDVLTSIENLVGSAFDDTLTGDGLGNVMDGGLGNDTMNGGAGIDTVSYVNATAAVTVNLSSLGVNVSGGAGSDALANFENINGSGFNDTLTGDGSANTIEGGAGSDSMNGGLGSDTASYASSTAGVNVSLLLGAINTGGHAAGDVLSGFENLTGSAFNDSLTGDGFANVLDAGAGDDMLVGGAGADQLIGGTGADTVSYLGASSAVTANLTTGVGTLGDANGDGFSGIENLTGSGFNDSLTGNAGANVLIGGAGNDTLSGLDGNDMLDVSSGRDSATGGNGDDTFLVNVNVANLPTLVNGDGNTIAANGGGDTIVLSGLTAGPYSLTALANVTANMEVLNIRDAISSSVGISSLDVRNFVDGGNASQIWIKADVGDAINLNLLAGETSQTVSVLGGTDYLVFNAANLQVAQIHWQSA